MIKQVLKITAICFLATLVYAFASHTAETGQEPWTNEQLIAPEQLAKRITDENSTEIFIFNIGPAGQIRTAVDIGEGRDKKNLKKLKSAVRNLPKNANIVIYCGCCPFADCPNIRPAFQLLSDMDFTEHKLLNLPQNLKLNWIDPGYPMEE